jgi:hypothetical protein
MKERFQELAEAYGGDISRWPPELREEASLWAAQEIEFARGVLAREARLDAALHELPRVAASADLFERIVGSAPPLKRRPRWRQWLAPAGLGAALAGVAAAGVLLGVQLSGRAAVTNDASGQSVAALDVSTVSEES